MENEKKYTLLDIKDNVAVAFNRLKKGTKIEVNNFSFILKDHVEAKHKFSICNFNKGDAILMYGQIIGKATQSIKKGEVLTINNIENSTQPYDLNAIEEFNWAVPEVSFIKNKTFMGYHRSDGQVGTDNVWLVFPLVFCENKSIEIIKKALEHTLGINKIVSYEYYAENVWNNLQNKTTKVSSKEKRQDHKTPQLPNVKVRFLDHHTGCGGTRNDARMLCKLLAGYLNNPNVAGASILSLGCQNAQESMLEEELEIIAPNFKKPLLWFNHQKTKNTDAYLKAIIEGTLKALLNVNLNSVRKPASLSKLNIGVECGGSDGFSGISANPMVGQSMDYMVALGGSVILSEFPELSGTESEIIKRCNTENLKNKFIKLMTAFEKRAEAVGSGFKDNPSPGNIREGLLTDAMKSAGAVRKGGTSSVNDVLDYGEYISNKGLSLLCTPGNDVESTTALAGSGANLILFTTGLGTPTGNPVSPVIKISSNTEISETMEEIIDINAGSIIDGNYTIEGKAKELLNYIIDVASGNKISKAVMREQHDFIPWKRDISL